MVAASKRRVGILGGSFDPVHNGHIGLAIQVRERFHLDGILFIPAYISPHKLNKRPTASNHRLAMLRLATASQPFFSISAIELVRKKVSFTIDTLTALLRKRPETEFYLIVGMDAFEGFNTWKAVHRLLELCHVIVAARPGYASEKVEETLTKIFIDSSTPYAPGIREGDMLRYNHLEKKTTLSFFDLPPVAVSSSQIRERIRGGEEIKNMLPPEVENYIIENQLYRSNSHP
ncbi:MAG: nicotinate-nicotinamide nucleotide adenylyltransferase [Nitrospinaceae bacterium]|nr:MAG: nicotinate-nicotinamide nucleotide adenylyltransferase [Nitrospinaceae bacterium]